MRSIKRNSLESNKKVMLFKISLKLFLSRCVLCSLLITNKLNRNMKNTIMNSLWPSQNLMKTLLLLEKRLTKIFIIKKCKIILTNNKITRFTITSQFKKKNRIILRLNRQSSSLLATLNLKKFR